MTPRRTTTHEREQHRRSVEIERRAYSPTRRGGRPRGSTLSLEYRARRAYAHGTTKLELRGGDVEELVRLYDVYQSSGMKGRVEGLEREVRRLRGTLLVVREEVVVALDDEIGGNTDGTD